MNTFKKVLAIGLAAVMSLMIVACGNGDGGLNSGETEKGKIVFGTNAEFPPFEYVTSNGIIGDFDGVDIAIAKNIADDMGKDVEIKNMEFDSLLIELDNGQVDAVIAGLSVTEERKEACDFSIPYYVATQVMIVKEGSDIRKAADMNGKRIAVIRGYTGQAYVEELGYEYETFTKGSESITELVDGKCDVLVIDSATAEKYVKDNEGLAIVEDPDTFGVEQYAVAVKKGNSKLLSRINEYVQKMLDNGTISDLSAEYLDKDIPDTATEDAE